MNRLLLLLLTLLSLTLLAGCPDSEGDADAAPSTRDAASLSDAASRSDAASSVDGSAMIDARVVSDGSAATDSGAATDGSAPSDASAAMDAARSSGSCDVRAVLCESLPPTCDRGEAPSVMGLCWGPCIPATMCTCTTPEECPDVPGFSETCHTGRGFCGPFL